MCCRQYICFVKWGAALFTYPKNVTPSWGSPLASLTRLIVPVIWVYMWVWGQQLLPFLICLEIQGLCSPGKWWKFLALNLKWSPWCQALRWDCGWGSQGHSRGDSSSSSPPSGLRNFVSYPQCTKTPSESSLFWNNLNSCKLVGPRDQIANICWIIDKARVPEKHLLLLYWVCQSLQLWGSPQTVGKKRWEYQTTLPASWEIRIQVKKQQLELHMEQWAGSKLGRKYVKAVYCHPAYLTYMHSTSWETLGWMKHKLESRLQG